jgi:hypothetical protein
MEDLLVAATAVVVVPEHNSHLIMYEVQSE